MKILCNPKGRILSVLIMDISKVNPNNMSHLLKYIKSNGVEYIIFRHKQPIDVEYFKKNLELDYNILHIGYRFVIGWQKNKNLYITEPSFIVTEIGLEINIKGYNLVITDRSFLDITKNIHIIYSNEKGAWTSRINPTHKITLELDNVYHYSDTDTGCLMIYLVDLVLSFLNECLLLPAHRP